MLMFIVRRVLAGIVLLAVISIVTFGLLFLDSANIARRILGQNATDELVAQKSAELGLDRPLAVQYWDWLTSALTGDLGRSWFNGQLVSVSLSGRLSVSLSLVIGATLISAVLAIVLGVLAARRGGWVDALVQFISVIGFAIPGFLIALYLVLIFAINLHWFKATGYIPITDSFGGWLTSVTLPIVALSIGMGVIPIAVPDFYHAFPSWFQTIFDSGISAAAVTAVLLNILFNVLGRKDNVAPIFAEGPAPGVTPEFQPGQHPPHGPGTPHTGSGPDSHQAPTGKGENTQNPHPGH